MRDSRTPIHPVALLALGAVLGLGACSAHPVIPASPVGEQAQWMLTLLNAELEVTPGELEPHFDESLTRELSAEEFAEIINEVIRPDRPFTATEHEGQARESVTLLESESRDPWQMRMVVNRGGALTTLVFEPVE